jgi:hypothetical protein
MLCSGLSISELIMQILDEMSRDHERDLAL